MIANGYAHEYTYDAPYQRQVAYKAAYKEAQTKDLGFWSAITCNGDTRKPAATPVAPAVPPTATTAPAAATAPRATPAPTVKPGARCNSSYPDVRIPPYPPDLDSKDSPYKGFRVVPADPHGFDADHDGTVRASRRHELYGRLRLAKP